MESVFQSAYMTSMSRHGIFAVQDLHLQNYYEIIPSFSSYLSGGVVKFEKYSSIDPDMTLFIPVNS